MKPHRLALATLVAASTLIPIHARAAPAEVIDTGSFKIYRNDRPLGAETFEYVATRESLVVRARQHLTVPSAAGDQPLDRGADVMVGRLDFALHGYQSNRTFQGATTIRGLVFADTHYVAFREINGKGEGDSRVLPPGHLYVMDSQLVTLFDIICRSLPSGLFPSRPLNLLALGPRDTLLEASASAVGNETIRWGGKPVVTRKLQLVADSRTSFTLWVGPRNQLLRLREPVGGFRAERDAPPVKRRPAPAPPKPKAGA